MRWRQFHQHDFIIIDKLETWHNKNQKEKLLNVERDEACVNFAIFVNPEEPRPDQHDTISKILISWLLMVLFGDWKKVCLNFLSQIFLIFLISLLLIDERVRFYHGYWKESVFEFSKSNFPELWMMVTWIDQNSKLAKFECQWKNFLSYSICTNHPYQISDPWCS